MDLEACVLYGNPLTLDMEGTADCFRSGFAVFEDSHAHFVWCRLALFYISRL